MNDPAVIREMLTAAHTIVVVGLSEDAVKPSHYVSLYMQRQGYRIVPVNPAVSEVLGEKAYARLADLPVTPDVVNVFRLPKFIPAIVEEMIELGLNRLWVQQGIVHEEAAMRAEAAGIAVVMDRCILVEHQKLQWEKRA
jgi:predicted CoA-binding protein